MLFSALSISFILYAFTIKLCLQHNVSSLVSILFDADQQRQHNSEEEDTLFGGLFYIRNNFKANSQTILMLNLVIAQNIFVLIHSVV